jgi:ABC-type spermidine/putrescine transport system permease subunit I
VIAIAVAGYITLGENPRAVALLRWIYRWPLFIPFVVAAQLMRTFLAKNGMLNNALMSLGVVDPMHAISLLDWRGVVITFVWKQLPFAALLISGAMASMDRSMIESARGLGAGRFRILLEIVVPQVRSTVFVALILSFVTMLSALSVPMMIIAGSSTMITVDMAWRVNSYGDYGVANALGFVSFAMSGVAAWFYLRQGIREGGKPA